MRIMMWLGYANACGLHEKHGISYHWALEDMVELDRTATRDQFQYWYRQMRVRAKLMMGFIGVIDTRVEVART